MAKNHDRMFYMKQCRKYLLEIKMLGPDQGVAFLRLKKKAEKALEHAKKCPE